MIIEVNDRDFQENVIEKSKQIPVLVDFWAPWCQPCLMLGPVLEKLAEEYRKKFILAKINVQENPVVASNFGISAIPAVKLFKDGKIVGEFMGVMPEGEIKKFLKKVEPTEADIYIKRGDEYYKLGKSEEAIKEYKNALEKETKNDLLQYKIGKIYFEQEKYVEAKKYLKNIEYLEEAQKLLDIIYFKETPVHNVEELKEKLTKIPDNIENSLNLANQYARVGNYQKSMDYYLSVLTKDKKYKDETARKSMLKIFNILGDDHPLTKEYRRKLTNVIF